MEADEYLTAFPVEYNKVYSLRYRANGKSPKELSGKDMSSEEFSQWLKLAQQTRADYLEGKITGEAMLAKIKVD